MINRLTISNMKLHDNSDIQFSPLTILTGMNGMGKSSIIQALLLLRQSFLMNDLASGMNLKGDLCDVGTSGELSCQSSLKESLDLKIEPYKISLDKWRVDAIYNYIVKQMEEQAGKTVEIREEGNEEKIYLTMLVCRYNTIYGENIVNLANNWFEYSMLEANVIETIDNLSYNYAQYQSRNDV